MSHSVRRFVLALGLASMVATVHGAWFAVSDAAGTSMAVARVRVSVWDPYEQQWASQYLAEGQAFRGAEGDVIELRPEVDGTSIASVPAFLETVSLATPPASACPTLAEACTIPVPNPASPQLAAAGTPLYLRLVQSQPVYAAGAPNPGAPATEVSTPSIDDAQAEDTQGSVGPHTVTLNVGPDAVSFTWDVTRWAKGDVFVGLNSSTYKVIDRHGSFKRFLASAELGRTDQYGDLTGPTTTGCAANWHTGEVHLTNFGGIDPAVNVITRHPGAGPLPYSDASRRLSTAIFRSDDEAERTSTDPDRARVFPIDLSPESVVFDANQNMLVGHSFAHFKTGSFPYHEGGDGEWVMDANYLAIENYGNIVDELGVVVMTRPMDNPDAPWEEASDGNTSNRLLHDANGALTFVEQTYTWGPGDSALLRLPTAYWEAASGAWLEAQNNQGNPIPVRRPLGKRLHRYNNQGTPGGASVYSPASRDIFWPFVSRQGTDWIDISSDQSTVYYTSENAYIHRFNTTTGEQLPDLGTGQYRRIGGSERFNALRILPPGDGTGGFIVAAGAAVLRLDQNGAIVQRYQAVHDPDVIQYANYSGNGLVQQWYSIEIDPGGRTFWAGARDTGLLYRFDLASGQKLQALRAVDYRPYDSPDAPFGREINAICIMWEYTAAQEVCFGPDGVTPDGVDNDGDGFIDESCTAIESCSIQSPGDDDGDGFSDHNDTDCGAELPPQATDDQYVMDQGDSLSVPANGVMSNDSDPDNLDGDPRNNDPVVVSQVGANPGSLASGSVGAVITTAQGGSATLAANGSLMYTPAVGFHGLDTLVYQVTDGASNSNTATVTIRVRPRIANDSYTMPQNSTLTVGGLDPSPAGILVNDSSQPMHVTGAGAAAPTAFTGSRTFTTSTGAQVTIADNGNVTYVPLSSFAGVDSFVYSGHDGTSAAVNTAVVTITVIDMNELVAVNDGTYSTAYETAIVLNLRSNDRDPEGHPFQIVAVNGQAIAVGGSVTVTGATVELDAAGNVRVTPAVGFSGLLTFQYSIQDAPPAPMTPVTATAEVRVEVAAPPLAGVTDVYTTQQNTTLTIAAPGVLSNDQGSGTLTVFSAGLAGALVPSVLGQPIVGVTGHVGSFALSPNGALTYTPRVNFVGRDTFKYNLKDSTGQVSNWIDVFIDVTPLSYTEVTTPSPTTYGAGATITATVRCGSNLTPSLGTVTFRLGATVIASGVPVVNGVATAAWPSSTPVGTYAVVAEYSGAILMCPGSSDDTTHQVNRAPLTVTADAQSKVYGTVFTFDGNEFTTSGLFFSDSVTSATLVSAGAAATATVAGSTYAITPSVAVGTGLDNYTIGYVNGPLTVTPRPLTVTADDDSKIYGTLTTFAGTEFSVAGLVNGDSVATASLSSTGAPVSAAATTHPIVASSATGSGLDNYAIGYVDGTLTVSARALTVTAVNQSKTYGQTFNFDGDEFTTAGLLAGDSVTSASLSSTGAVNTATVGGGPYTIAIADAVGSGVENYDITYVTGLLTVNQAPLTVRADAQTKPYGMTFSFDGNEFTTAGLLFPTDTVTGATLNSAGSAPTASVAGSTYAIVPSAAGGTGLSNYTITYANGAMTVTAIPLTITASDRTKVYGTTVTFAGTEFTAVGLINGDTVTSVSLSSTGAPASASTNVTYPIQAASANGSGLSNYAIAYVDGTLTVSSRVLTLTAQNQSKTYGQAFTFDGDEFTTAGLLAGDSVTSVSLSSAGEANTATVAGGPYTIAIANAVGSGLENYTISYVTGLLTVNRAPLTVRADAQTKPYGMTFSFDGNEFTTAGLLFPTDTVTGATLNSAGSAPTASVAGSTYAIVPSAAGGTGLSNYTITYVNGQMTVTAIPLTITASDRTKVYGTAVTFAGSEFTASGLVNGDAVNSVSLSSTGAPASAAANTTYPIVPTAAAGSGLGNYVITYANGTLSVTRKAATVTAGSGTKVIGSADPALTTTQSGFLASDLSAITLQTTRAAGETVNTYATTATASGTPLSNYDVTYNGGTFTITNRAPVAQNDSAATTATIPVAIAVLGNDSDPDGHTITIESFTQPAGGTVTLSGSTFTFTANLGFFGPTTFTYTITDGYGLTSTATVTVTVQSAGGAYRTQTQGGWGTSPSGNNPGAFLAANFASVFTSGYVQVGGTYTLRFTSAAKVDAFLPAGGKAGKLTANGVNVTTSKGGVFAGQVLALQISVAFSNAGKTRYGLASLTVQSGKLAGQTVAQVLALANSVLGGGALPSNLTISDLNDIVDKINNNFVDGTTDMGYLR